MPVKILFFVLLSLFSSRMVAQEEGESYQHVHDHHKYHLGFGVAGTHFIGENGIAPGFHLHFLRQLGEQQNWGIGVGIETIMEENLHSSVNFLLNYHLLKYVSLNAGPGLVFGKHDGESEVSPAFHTEAVFEFDLNRIHIGPMVGIGFDKENTHFSIGVHAGFGF